MSGDVENKFYKKIIKKIKNVPHDLELLAELDNALLLLELGEVLEYLDGHHIALVEAFVHLATAARSQLPSKLQVVVEQ